MSEEQTQTAPPPNPEDFLLKPSRFDQATARLLSLPWWIIALVLVFLYAAFTISGSEQYQDILAALLDDPQQSTTNKFNVVYEVDAKIIILQETVSVTLADGSRQTIDASAVVERQEGTLVCDKTADPDCLDEFGELVTFRLPLTEGATEAGVMEQQGLFRPNDNRVELPDGSSVVVAPEAILTQAEGTLECDRVLDPTCTDKTGEIVTFAVPYQVVTGLLNRNDVLILHSDGYQETVRPNRLRDANNSEAIEWAVETCERAENPYCRNGQISVATFRERVIGTETGRSNGIITVRTVDEQTVFIPRNRVLEMEVGTIECDEDANPRCQDFEGTIIQRAGEIIEGELTVETNRALNIIRTGETTATEWNKSDVILESRTPADCRVEDEGTCEIQIKLVDDEVAGRIIGEDDGGITVQTVAPVFVELDQETAISTRRAPMTCALNNIRGCNAGLWLTIMVTIVAYSLALMIGLLVGLMRVSSNPIIFHASTFYVEIIRGTPLLVLLLFFAFVIGPSIRDSNFPPFEIFYDFINKIEVAVLGEENFLAEAVLGLAIGYGAFLAEVFRAGIESIGRGQMEAARSLGMSYPQAMRKVILPQAIRVVLPPLGNDFIAMLKDSALISVLALPDMLQQGRLYITRTFQPIPVYVIVALLYVFLTLLLSMLVRYLEKRFRLP